MYRLCLRSSRSTAHPKFWGCPIGRPPEFGAGAFASHYTLTEAKQLAESLMAGGYGYIDITNTFGGQAVMWETEKDFEFRVAAEVKRRMDALPPPVEAKPKSTWIGGVAPEYYRIEIPALGVTVMPFDLIDALKLNFNLGCVVKYVLRAGRKGPALDDLRKARNCIDREIVRQEATPMATPIFGDTQAKTATTTSGFHTYAERPLMR